MFLNLFLLKPEVIPPHFPTVLLYLLDEGGATQWSNETLSPSKASVSNTSQRKILEPSEGAALPASPCSATDM